MSGNTIETQHDSHEDLRWDMSEVKPFRQENDSGKNNEKLEKDPSQLKLEKEEKLQEAREQVENVYRKITTVEAKPAVQAPVPTPERRPVRKNTVGQVLKKTVAVTGSTAVVMGAAAAMIFAPPSIPLALPVALAAADSVIHSIAGVNGSMFRVDSKNMIKQRINPLPVLLRYRGKSSTEIFNEETRRLFDGLKPGETYNTKSHSMTYALLRIAEKEGRIEDLTREKTGKKSRLFLENIVTGNWKAIRSGKKHDIYNISFKVV